ncbi:MAG TPA: 4-hydroxythreonine-4-phosphate dehydrogenase PdxA, partial [Polyangiaceae bacterium]|nr:4-hydroxythreonine-4-phosphate dehydrogenase PdxA [Polyangiaceae bacterium]
MRARIALSVGCPCGVGPEVSVAAAAAERGAQVLLVGDGRTIEEAAKGRGIDAGRVVRVSEPGGAWALPRGRVAVWQPTNDLRQRDRRPGAPTAASGAAQLAWVDAACDVVVRGDADALVTGPVSKGVIASLNASRAARQFLGHTEHLQRRLHAREVTMAFANEKLTTALVTTHL